MESEQLRDRIITTYREEIKMYSARERDFKALQEAFLDLQRRLRLADGDMQSSQREYEERLSS
jgi:hypothetical protein